MIEPVLFRHLPEPALAEFLRNAERLVCYAAPGIQTSVARAIIDAARRIGPEAVTVSLDLDEQVIRMGYGTLEGVQLLQEAGILLNHSPGLRMGLAIADADGYSFTPNALLLEADRKDDRARNALRLSPDQIGEALARLSPAAKAIAVAGARDEGQRSRIKALPLEVEASPVDRERLEKVRARLEEAPPVRFDLARQVRVFQPHLQYVEISLTGAAIQRHRITVPEEIQKIGAVADLEGRLRTTFRVIEKDDRLSSKPIEKRLNEIRHDLTPSLGRHHGRVVLKSAKSLLEKRLKSLCEGLEQYRQRLAKELQERLDQSRKEIVDYYLPRVIEDPPDSLRGQCPVMPPSEEYARRWLERVLGRVFPDVENLLKDMKLEVVFKDVTFESLNRDDFLDSLKQAYPEKDWDRAHDEFLAAGQNSNHDNSGG